MVHRLVVVVAVKLPSMALLLLCRQLPLMSVKMLRLVCHLLPPLILLLLLLPLARMDNCQPVARWILHGQVNQTLRHLPLLLLPPMTVLLQQLLRMSPYLALALLQCHQVAVKYPVQAHHISRDNSSSSSSSSSLRYGSSSTRIVLLHLLSPRTSLHHFRDT